MEAPRSALEGLPGHVGNAGAAVLRPHTHGPESHQLLFLAAVVPLFPIPLTMMTLQHRRQQHRVVCLQPLCTVAPPLRGVHRLQQLSPATWLF